MFFVSDALLDQILTDDIPYGDATTALLGIEKVPGIVRCRPKAETTIAGVALAERLFTRVGLQTTCFHEEGDTVDAGTVILEGRGPAGAIHAVYKTAQNILEYASGIATRTHQMVQEAKAGNAACRVAWGYPNPFSCSISTASSFRILKSDWPKPKKRIPNAKSLLKPPMLRKDSLLRPQVQTSSSVKSSPPKRCPNS